ncbi:MAG: hypothetical protein ACRDUA_12135, partial [Micromonosporaceae bacterium]
GNSNGHDAGQNFFLVHLQSLTDFARELQTQVSAIRTPTQSIGGLATHPFPLGSFAEGDGLHARHQATASEVHQMLESARAAIEFAGDVTDIIASSYQRYDDHVADLYNGHTTAPPPAGGNGGRPPDVPPTT